MARGILAPIPPYLQQVMTALGCSSFTVPSTALPRGSSHPPDALLRCLHPCVFLSCVPI